jgi:trehalose 6-phosphate synthase/phosphatase
MSTSKFIIVSNRLPVSISRDDNGILKIIPSTGGLATAMSSLESGDVEKLWIGWPGISNEDLRPGERGLITRKLRTYGCYPVFMNREQIKNFYEGYSNDTLWPMFHYFQTVAQFHDEYWRAYKEVNILFKKAVVKQADPLASIWVHDYHLMLLPKMLRDALPGGAIGFFLHIPFPSYEVFRLLPERRQILEGLLGADLVGFHIYDYARHFLSSTLRILGVEHLHGSVILPDRIVRVDAFPIGIDYHKFVNAVTNDAGTLAEIKTLEEHYGDQRVIISVDRLDYSKGILHRLEAFEQFLKDNPHYHKKVVLVIIAVPSRTEVETYRELRDVIEKTVSRINGTYAAMDWSPISYQFRNLPFAQIAALYARADVALVTPIRDGMNLVAKEFVAAKQRSAGVLILSEMTGAVEELPEALRINPNDTDSVVAAIKTALRMSKREQRNRLLPMQKRLSRYTVQRWSADFMEQLHQAKSDQDQQYAKSISSDVTAQIRHDFVAAKQRLILLDYDGTLHELVPTPNPRQSMPSKALLDVLRRLSSLPHTTIAIVSGRPKEALELWFRGLRVSLVAEHGAWVRQGGEWSQADIAFRDYKKIARDVMERYAERTPGALVEEKDYAIVWHYRNVAPELAYARNSRLRHDLMQALDHTDVGVYGGHKVIEVKPRAINKGTVALELLAMNPADFVMAIGDDHTDEDMFEVLQEDDYYTIKVGLGETHARLQVAGVQQVRSLLSDLAESKV